MDRAGNFHVHTSLICADTLDATARPTDSNEGVTQGVITASVLDGDIVAKFEGADRGQESEKLPFGEIETDKVGHNGLSICFCSNAIIAQIQ